MTQRTTKTVTISMPPAMVDDLDRVRQREHRTRSELLREALRQYMATSGEARTIRVADMQPDEIKAIRQGKRDFARGETVRLEDIQNELGLPTR
jgi:predicted transcriptional regulator